MHKIKRFLLLISVAVGLLSSPSHDNIDSLVTASEIAAHQIDSAVDQCQVVVNTSETNVGIKTNLDHSSFSELEEVVEVVLPDVGLEMPAIELKHGGLELVRLHRVNVGKDAPHDGPEHVEDVAELV